MTTDNSMLSNVVSLGSWKIFTTSGTYTKPAGLTTVKVTVDGDTTTAKSGGAGAPGIVIVEEFF